MYAVVMIAGVIYDAPHPFFPHLSAYFYFPLSFDDILCKF